MIHNVNEMDDIHQEDKTEEIDQYNQYQEKIADEIAEYYNNTCIHDYKLVWLTDELQGFRCKLCRNEVLDIDLDLFLTEKKLEIFSMELARQKESCMEKMNNEIDTFIDSLGKAFPVLTDGCLEQLSEEIGTKLWDEIWNLD